MQTTILALAEEIRQKLAAAKTPSELEAIRLAYFSRQGAIADIMTTLKTMSTEEKRIFGPLLNEFKQSTQELFFATQHRIEKEIARAVQEKDKHFDVTLSIHQKPRGSLHPYTHLIKEFTDIFISMGFQIATGPELETDFYNFESLNIPADHPAREESDTFWLPDFKRLLRTQTSPVQIRTMQNQQPPIAIVAPGRVYRNEATDASHDFMFMQIEGMYIAKEASIANLLAILKTSLEKLFAQELTIRVRPGFFPFVEPGLEIDISCPFCKNGCSTCKKTGWIEMLGAGMIHPNVLRAGGIDPDLYRGFAFGMGLTRLAMLKYHISDLRLLHSGNIKFLEQFS